MMDGDKKRSRSPEHEIERDIKRRRLSRSAHDELTTNTKEQILNELVGLAPALVKDLANGRMAWAIERWGHDGAAVLSPVVRKLAKNLSPMSDVLETAWEVALSDPKRTIRELPKDVRHSLRTIKAKVIDGTFEYEWQVWLALDQARQQFASNDPSQLRAMNRAIGVILKNLQDHECLQCGKRRTRRVLCDWRFDGLVCKKAMCLQCCSAPPSSSSSWFCPRHPKPASSSSASTSTTSGGASTTASSSLSSSSSSSSSLLLGTSTDSEDDGTRCWGERVCESDEIGAVIRDVWQDRMPPSKPGEPELFSFFVAVNALTNDWESLPLQLPCASPRRGERNLKLMVRPFKSIWKQVLDIARGGTGASASVSGLKQLQIKHVRDRYHRAFLSPIADLNLEDRLLARVEVIECLKRAHVRLIEELSKLKGLDQIEHLIDQALARFLSQQTPPIDERDQPAPKRAESVYQAIQSRVPFLSDLLARLQQTNRVELVNPLQSLLERLRQPFETAETGTFHSFALLGETGCGKSFLIDMLLLLSRSNEQAYQQDCKEIKIELERRVAGRYDKESVLPHQDLQANNAQDHPLSDIQTTRHLQAHEEELQALLHAFQAQEREAQEQLWRTDTAHEQYSFLLPAGVAVMSTTAVPIVIRRAEIYMASIEYLSPNQTVSSLLRRARESLDNGSAAEQTQVLEAAGAILGRLNDTDEYLDQLAAEADQPGARFEELVLALCQLLSLDEKTERDKPTSFVFFGGGVNALADRLFLRLVLRCTQGIRGNPFPPVPAADTEPPQSPSTTFRPPIEQLLHVSSFEGYQLASEFGMRVLPALRKVIVRCPSKVAPINGQLVDLPGTNDPIEIRNQIRDQFLQHASFVAVLYDAKFKQDVLRCLNRVPVWRNIAAGQANAATRMAIICNLEKASGSVSLQDLRDRREERARSRQERAVEVQRILKSQVRAAAEKERIAMIPHLVPTIRRFVGNVLNTAEVLDLDLNQETDMYSVLGLLEFFFMDIVKRGTLDVLQDIERVQRQAESLGSKLVPEARYRTTLCFMRKQWIKRVEEQAIDPFRQAIEQANGTRSGLTRAHLQELSAVLLGRFEDEVSGLMSKWHMGRPESIAPETRNTFHRALKSKVHRLKAQVENLLQMPASEWNRPLRVVTCEELALSPIAKLVHKIGGWTMFSRVASTKAVRNKYLRNFGKGYVEELAENWFKCITEAPEVAIHHELQHLSTRILDLSKELHLDKELSNDPASWVECGRRLARAYRHERLLQAELELGGGSGGDTTNEGESGHQQYESLTRSAAANWRQHRVYLSQDASSAFDAWLRFLGDKATLHPITCQLPVEIQLQPLANTTQPLFCRALLGSLFPSSNNDTRLQASELLRVKLRFAIAVRAPQSLIDQWVPATDRELLAKQLALDGKGEDWFSLTWLASALKINVLVLVGQQDSIACWRLIGNTADPSVGHVLACLPSNDGSAILRGVKLLRRSSRHRLNSSSNGDAAAALPSPSSLSSSSMPDSPDIEMEVGAEMAESTDGDGGEDQDFDPDEELPGADDYDTEGDGGEEPLLPMEQPVIEATEQPFQRYKQQVLQSTAYLHLPSWRVLDPSTVELNLTQDPSGRGTITRTTCTIEQLKELVNHFAFFVDAHSCCERNPRNSSGLCEVRVVRAVSHQCINRC